MKYIRKKEKGGVPLPNFSFMITRTQPQKTLATFLENLNQSLEILQLFQANNSLKVWGLLDAWYSEVLKTFD